MTNGLPDYEETGSNFKSLTWSITQVETLGFSTNDKSEDMETEYVKVKNNDAITSTWSFVVDSGYMFHALICGHGSGSAADYTLKVGYSAGTAEILTDIASLVPLAGGENVVFNIHEQIAFASDTTIYVTLTGVGAVGKIYANLIYNTSS